MNTETIARICDAISGGFLDDAAAIARADLPFKPPERARQKLTETQSVSVFLRDGFIDRYSGQRLVFPGTLRLLSLLLPEEIPYHPHGKLAECHTLFWLLFPMVDHVEPVARGGSDTEDNWVCVSWPRNSAKGVQRLDELGWQLQPPGSLDDWDGMLCWFMEYVSDHPCWLEINYIKRWHRAAQRALAAHPQSDLCWRYP